MRKDTVKIGLGAIGVGIIGYGLYSMKKDTEKILQAPGSFLDGLFDLPDKLLGGSGLPGAETEPTNSGSSTKKPSPILPALNEYATKLNPLSSENLDNFYNKSGDAAIGAASWTWEKYTDLLKKDPLYGMKLGTSLIPGGSAVVGISQKAISLFDSPQGKTSGSSKTGSLPIVPSSSIKPTDTILDVKKSLDLSIPMTRTKYTEKSSSSSSSSYTDSTGRVYTPTSVIKAKW